MAYTSSPARLRRLNRTPPPGCEVCRSCLCFRAAPSFITRMGNKTPYCASCRTYRSRHSRKRRHRYLKTPNGRGVAYRLHDAFIKARPHHNALYHFRDRLDETWKHGAMEARRWLSSLGYAHTSACQICGSTQGLAVFWPDYTQPCRWIRLCGKHRVVERERDTRTPAQVNEQLAQVRDEMRCIYKRARAFLPLGIR